MMFWMSFLRRFQNLLSKYRRHWSLVLAYVLFFGGSVLLMVFEIASRLDSGRVLWYPTGILLSPSRMDWSRYLCVYDSGSLFGKYLLTTSVARGPRWRSPLLLEQRTLPRVSLNTVWKFALGMESECAIHWMMYLHASWWMYSSQEISVAHRPFVCTAKNPAMSSSTLSAHLSIALPSLSIFEVRMSVCTLSGMPCLSAVVACE